MNMTQSNPLSQDIKNIMADQLYEMRMLREDMKISSEKNNTTASPINPYAMNAYYTENHDKMIDQAYSSVSSGQSLVNTLSGYANDSGYADVMLAKDGFIGNRGISAREEILAKDAMSTSIQRGILEKGRGLFSFGGDMAGTGVAGGAATLAGLGAIPGIGLGIVGGWAAGKLTKHLIDNQVSYLDYRDTLMASSDRFMTIGEGEDPLMLGFDKGEAKKAARDLVRISNDVKISDEDMSEIFTGALNNNLLTGVHDVESFEKNMKNLTENVRTAAKSLGKTYSEITNMMGELSQAGISTDMAANVLGSAGTMSASLGMTSEGYLSQLAFDVVNKTRGTGLDPDEVVGNQIRFDSIAAARINRAKNDYGDDENYNNFIKGLSSKDMQSYFKAAAYEYDGGEIEKSISMASMKYDDNGRAYIDENEYKKISRDIQEGNLSIDSLKIDDVDFNAWKSASAKFRDSYGESSIYSAVATATEALKVKGIGAEEISSMKIGELERTLANSLYHGINDDKAREAMSMLMAGELKSVQGNKNYWKQGDIDVSNTITSRIRDSIETTKGIPWGMDDFDPSDDKFQKIKLSDGPIDFFNLNPFENAKQSANADAEYEILTAAGIAILGGEKGNKLQNKMFRSVSSKGKREDFISTIFKTDTNKASAISFAHEFGEGDELSKALNDDDIEKAEEIMFGVIDRYIASSGQEYTKKPRSEMDFIESGELGNFLDGAIEGSPYEDMLKPLLEKSNVYGIDGKTTGPEKDTSNMVNNVVDVMASNNSLLERLLKEFNEGMIEQAKILKNNSSNN